MKTEIRIRVPQELKDKLEEEAKKMNISLSSYVRIILSK